MFQLPPHSALLQMHVSCHLDNIVQSHAARHNKNNSSPYSKPPPPCRLKSTANLVSLTIVCVTRLVSVTLNDMKKSVSRIHLHLLGLCWLFHEPILAEHEQTTSALTPSTEQGRGGNATTKWRGEDARGQGGTYVSNNLSVLITLISYLHFLA